MITQLITNSRLTSDLTDYQNTFNYSVGNQIFEFDFNHTLKLSRDYDAVVPKYIIIHLYANDIPILTQAEHIHNVCRLFSKIRLIMQISGQQILQFPLSLLHELSPANLHHNKLYIKIPFSAFLNQINVVGLYHSNVTFIIKDFNEIINYASYYSLATKVYMHDIEERNNMTNIHSRNFIQQIGTLHVTNTNMNTDNGRTFQINTNCLNGPTKGLLIQCSILDLQSIKFYINDLLRFDYDHFLILTACVKLSENLLYFPFNDCFDFQDKGTNTFAGAINLSRLQNSTLCLQFSRDQSKIVIHNVYFNYFRQAGGLSVLCIDYIPNFITSTTDDHPIQSIVGMAPNAELIDLSGNYIINDRIRHIYSNTTSFFNHVTPVNGQVSGNYINALRSGFTGPGPDYPVINNNSTINNHTIPNGLLRYRSINPDRITCNITHEDIGVDIRYMTCTNCENNFLESAIKQWLRQHAGNSRTCPTCREVWTNFDIYINQNLPEEYIYSMPE
jgi:hypothetical protein